MASNDRSFVAPRLSIKLLGGMNAEVGGLPLPRMRSRKESLLLALLVLERGREIPRRRLAQKLWPFPDFSEDCASRNLRRSLTELRQALGPEAHRLKSPAPRTLCLDLTGAEVDILRFEEALAQNSPASWEQAIALYDGPLLDGYTEDWILPERERRQQDYQEALAAFSAQALSSGDFATAERCLRRAAAVNPFFEPVQRALMETLARGGDAEGALQIYRDLDRRLHQSHNAVPATETVALFVHIRDAARRTGPRAASGARPFPTPRRLPRPLTRLIGREEHVRQIDAQLRLSRLVTLMGPGGVGKTRLALQVAHESGSRYDNGAWFIEMAAFSSPSQIVPHLAFTFGVREEPGVPLMDGLLERLHDHALLLVLDNCEHLMPECARVAEQLLAALPRLRILATSRQSLGLTGESRRRVPPLSVPSSQVSSGTEPELLTRHSAVELFLERAAAQTGFQLTEANSDAVVQICRHLDGLPLAIELAAAQLNVLSTDQLARRLSDRFHLLTQGSAAAPPRHMTLRGLIDWSYALLSPPEQTLFARLAVFSGGWTLAAVEAVCTDKCLAVGQIIGSLAGLIDKSLVVGGQACRDELRYTMLETLREYAGDRIPTAQRNALRRRHAEYFLSLAEEAEPEMSLKRQGGQWPERLEADLDNMRAALEWCRTQPGEEGLGLRLAAALSGFWYVRGLLGEGWEHLSDALTQADTRKFAEERAKALRRAGRLAWLQGESVAAQAYHTESLELYRQLGSPGEVAVTLCHLGLVAGHVGDHRQGTALLEQGRALLNALGDQSGMAHVLNCLGDMAWLQGDYALAESLQQESLTLSRQIGDEARIAYSLTNLGNIACARGDYALARDHLTEGLSLFERVQDAWGIGYTQWSLGGVCRRQGDLAQAGRLGRIALRAAVALENKWGIAFTLEALAFLAVDCRRDEEAVRMLAAADALRAAMRAPIPAAQRPDWEHSLATARTSLGEEAFAQAWRQGVALPLEVVTHTAASEEMEVEGDGRII